MPVVSTPTPGPEDMLAVQIDGWLMLRVRRAHLHMVHQARQVLTLALAQYLRAPVKPLDRVLGEAVDRIAEALSIQPLAGGAMH